MGVRKKVVSYQLPVTSFKKSTFLLFITTVLLAISGCSGKPERLGRIVLLAPFEGRYREIGYNAYYAAKLALKDYGGVDIELVAIDDGGTVTSATDRAQALANDPLVKAVIALGYAATNEETQAAFGNLPQVVVGYWGAEAITPNTFMLTSPMLGKIITLPQADSEITAAAQIETAITGSDVLALQQFKRLNPNHENITVISSGNLPDETFTNRYVESAAFTPQPGLLATLTYDATGMILDAISHVQNGNVSITLAEMDYKGLNGDIRFENGYWADAPVHYFQYDANGDLLPVDRAIE